MTIYFVYGIDHQFNLHIIKTFDNEKECAEYYEKEFEIDEYMVGWDMVTCKERG